MATVEELAARVAALETRFAVSPLATTPPVRVGEITDTPVPGSPIASAWANEITNRIRHRFVDVATRDANWPAATAGAGALCVTLDTLTAWQSDGSAWHGVQGTAVAAGHAEGSLGATSAPGVRDVLNVPLGTFAGPVRVVVNAVCWFGFGSGAITGSADVFSIGLNGSVITGPSPVRTEDAVWSAIPLLGSFDVPAGTSRDFKVRFNLQAGANCWNDARCNYTVIAV